MQPRSSQNHADEPDWTRRVLLAGGAAFGLLANASPAAASPDAPSATDPASASLSTASVDGTGHTGRRTQLLTDFPWLARYAAENALLLEMGTPVDIVFMGDSIAERWHKLDPAFFLSGRVCRGIGGQTTPQMVLRMMADVVALRPRAVHIMGGINDIAGNTGPMTPAQTLDNIHAMTTLAQSAGITVILGSMTPAAAFHWRPGMAPAQRIIALNADIKAYAARAGVSWVDYHAALAGPDAGMGPGLSSDGVHPMPAGYAIMDALLRPVLAARGLA